MDIDVVAARQQSAAGALRDQTCLIPPPRRAPSDKAGAESTSQKTTPSTNKQLRVKVLHSHTSGLSTGQVGGDGGPVRLVARI